MTPFTATTKLPGCDGRWLEAHGLEVNLDRKEISVKRARSPVFHSMPIEPSLLLSEWRTVPWLFLFESQRMSLSPPPSLRMDMKMP